MRPLAWLVAILSSLALDGCASVPSTPEQRSAKKIAPHEIAFGAFRFDPAQGLPAFPEGLAPNDAPCEIAGVARRPFFVQLHEAPRAEHIIELRTRHALALTAYASGLAYLELLESSTLEAVKRDPLIRAVVPYPPAVRLAPIFLSDTPPDRSVLVKAFTGVAPEAVRSELEAIGLPVNTQLTVPSGEPARFVVELKSNEDAAAIARLGCVQWIEQVPRIDPD